MEGKLILRIRSNYGQLRLEFNPQEATFLTLKKQICNYYLDNGEELNTKQISLHVDSLENPAINQKDQTLLSSIDTIENGTILYVKQRSQIVVRVFIIQGGQEKSENFTLNYKKETLGHFHNLISSKFLVSRDQIELFTDAQCKQKIEEDQETILQDILTILHGSSLYCKLKEITQNQGQSQNQQQQQQQQGEQSLYEQLLQQQGDMSEDEMAQLIEMEQQFNNQEKKQPEMPPVRDFGKNNLKLVNLKLRTKNGQINYPVDANEENYKEFKCRIGSQLGIPADRVSVHFDKPINEALKANNGQKLSQIEGLDAPGEIIYIRDNETILINVATPYSEMQHELKIEEMSFQQFVDMFKNDLGNHLRKQPELVSFQLKNNEGLILEQNSQILPKKLSEIQSFQHGKTIILENIKALDVQTYNLRLKYKQYGQIGYEAKSLDKLNLLQTFIQENFKINIEDQEIRIQTQNDEDDPQNPIVNIQDNNLTISTIDGIQNGSTLIIKNKNMVGFKFQFVSELNKDYPQIQLFFNPNETSLGQLRKQLCTQYNVQNQNDLKVSMQKTFNKFIGEKLEDSVLMSAVMEFKFKCIYYIKNVNEKEQQNLRRKKSSQQKKDNIEIEQDQQKRNQEENKSDQKIEEQIIIRLKSQQGQYRFNLNTQTDTIQTLTQEIVAQTGEKINWKENYLEIEEYSDFSFESLDPRTFIKDIEYIENGSVILLKNRFRINIKLDLLGSQVQQEVDLKKETVLSLKEKLASTYVQQLYKIEFGLVFRDKELQDPKALIKNYYSLENSNKDILKVVKIKDISENKDGNQMELEKSDQIKLRFISPSGRFNLDIDSSKETFLSVKFMVMDQINKGQLKQLSINDYEFIFEETGEIIEVIDDIPLKATEMFENGTLIKLSNKNQFTLFFTQIQKKNQIEIEGVQEEEEKKNDEKNMNKLEIDPQTYTYEQLRHHIRQWLGIKKGFISLHLSDKDEDQILEKIISDDLKKQQGLPVNSRQNSNIQQQQEQEQQEQDVQLQHQQSENFMIPVERQNQMEFEDGYDDDEGDYSDSYEDFEERNNRNRYNMVGFRYGLQAQNIYRDHATVFDSYTISQIPILENKTIIYASQNLINFKLINHVNKEKNIEINPKQHTFKELIDLVADEMKMNPEFVALYVGKDSEEPLDYKESTKIKNIKELVENCQLVVKCHKISLRVEVAQDSDQQESFNVDLKSSTFGHFINLVASWYNVGVNDFSLHFEKPDAEPIQGNEEDKIADFDFIKNLSMTSKIYLQENENCQLKSKQLKYNKRQCKLVMQNQANLVKKINELFYHMRNNITIDRNNFIKGLYNQFMGPNAVPVNINNNQLTDQMNFTQVLSETERHQQTLGHMLNIKFEGEYGLDWGGVTDDFFSLLSTQLLDDEEVKQLKFQESNNLIHPTGFIDPEIPEFYKFIGRMFGMMFRHKRNCGVRFHPIFYKLIGIRSHMYDSIKVVVRSKEEEKALLQKKLEIRKKRMELEGENYDSDDSDEDELYEFGDIFQVTIDDLKDYDQTNYRCLKYYLLEKDNIDWEDQFLDFNVFDPIEKRPIALGGKQNTDVNKDNITEYVRLNIEYILKLDKLKEMARGFQDVIPVNLLTKIGNFKKWEHISDLIEGSNVEISVPLLQNNVRYEGYKPSHPTIKLFWTVLNEDFNEKERRQLLYYITGKKKLPLNGFKAFKDPKLQGINITYDSKIDRLPEGHTCFHQLILPAYNDRKQMVKKLKMAMKQEAMYIV